MQVNLMDFINNMKKGGLYVFGSVLEGDYLNGAVSDKFQRIKAAWVDFISEAKFKVGNDCGAQQKW